MESLPNEPIAWKNGCLVGPDEAAVPFWDLGVVAGATISEMARTYARQPFRLSKHVQRLVQSCQELEFPLNYSEQQLVEAAQQIVQLRLSTAAVDVGIVWFVTAGANVTYLGHSAAEPTVCVHSFDLPFHLWQNAVQTGVRLTIPPQRQLPGDSFPVEHKTRNRLHWWLADRAAARQRSGSRALLVDADGLLTETSTACFYAVRDGAVLTPRRGVLRSTTRDIVREVCDRLGLRFRQTDLPADEQVTFEECFLSSTPCGLLPVKSIGDVDYPGPDGPVLKQLQQEWTRLTGVDTFQQICDSGIPTS